MCSYRFAGMNTATTNGSKTHFSTLLAALLTDKKKKGGNGNNNGLLVFRWTLMSIIIWKSREGI